MSRMSRNKGARGEREAALVTKVDEANRQIARLQIELDATCNAEELRQARREREQWRECAQRLAVSIAWSPLVPTKSMEAALAEFERLKGATK